MREEVRELVEILDRQDEMMQTAAEYSEEKTEAVIQGDIQKLESIIGLEVQWLEAQQELEGARMRSVRALAHAMGLPEEIPTLETLCAGMEPEDSEPLRALQGRLKAAVGRQKQLNRINEKLIGMQLEQIDIMLNSLTQLPASTYTGQGMMNEKPAKKQGVFDFTV